MDISTSAVTGALRVGVQVLVAQRRPMLEVYHEVNNMFGPEHEFSVLSGVGSGRQEIHKHRFQDIFISFSLINIGAMRAENVVLSIGGQFKRHAPRENLGEMFLGEIPQMAPGQAIYLFRLEQHDLHDYPPDGGKPIGLRKEQSLIRVDYNGPSVGLNRIFRLPSRIFGTKQFSSQYVFEPRMVATDLPPAKYS